jgi:hypothetical protein
MLDDSALTSSSPNSILRVRGTLSRANGHWSSVRPKPSAHPVTCPLPRDCGALGWVQASQAVERLKAASILVETGLVFTTGSGTAVNPRRHCGRSEAAKAWGMNGVGWHTLALICRAHARGGGATAYRLAAVSTDGALCRPAVLSSNGLVRMCAVATPFATPLLHGSKEAASDFVRNGL